MLRRFFSYYKPYKKLFLLDFTCAVVAGLLELGFPIAVNQFVDKLLPGKDWSLIVWASAALLGIYVLNTVLNYIVTYWGHMLGVNIETNMRKKCSTTCKSCPSAFSTTINRAPYVAHFQRLDNIGEVAHHGPEDLFIAGMTLVGSFLLMLAINWKLAVLTFLVVPVLVWAALYFNGKMTKTYRGLFSALADFNSRVEENIGGIRVVQAFCQRRARKGAVQRKQPGLSRDQTAGLQDHGRQLVGQLYADAARFFVRNGLRHLVRHPRRAVLRRIRRISAARQRVYPADRKINAIIESYPKGIAGFKRYVEIMDTAPDVADAPDAADAGKLKGDIEFDRVSFAYEGKDKVLDGISLSIRAGERSPSSGVGRGQNDALQPAAALLRSGRRQDCR
ncbi:hypothetical protein HMSSN036_10790 [Paenibacillus macerans]|nr:hypothetical protein HMSSN036_10790 [Paenibacillus macerans]